MTAPAIKAFEQVYFDSSVVAVCGFHCPADHPSFRDSGPSNANTFVFPRTFVRVHREDGSSAVGGLHGVSLFNRGEQYTRSPVSPEGSRCDWLVVADPILRSAIAAFDPRRAESDRPFRAPHVPIDAATLSMERRMLRRLRERPAPPADAIEETAIELLHRTLRQLYADSAPGAGARRLGPRARDLVEDTKRWLARHFTEDCSLAAVAAAMGVSVYYLAHVFRQRCGLPIHRFVDQLRLRAALEELEAADRDLTDLALGLGYSAHSHFTERFRRAFGCTPSAYRAARRPPGPKSAARGVATRSAARPA